MTNYRAVIFTKNDCPFCVRAKDLLSDRGIGYEELKYEDDFSKRMLLFFIKGTTDIQNSVTVPQIYVDTGENYQTLTTLWEHDWNHIGGYEELVKFFEKLDKKRI